MHPGSMTGRVCLVTGANRGIGLCTARGLAELGARVMLVCRDRTLGESALKEIRDRTGNDSVELVVGDLGSTRSVRSLTDEIKKRLDTLHVLVNNAGVVMSERLLTEDGHETTFAVNHLGPCLLTHCLRDLLIKSAPARVVTVSSQAHRRGRIDLDDLDAEKNFNGLMAYCNSKLANVLFTYELARMLDGTGVTANCLHPGSVRTRMVMESFLGVNGFTRALRPLISPFLTTPEKGALTSIYLASSPEVKGVSGRYFMRRKEARSSSTSRDLETARGLWKASAGLVGI